MEKPEWIKSQRFSPIIQLPEKFYVHDFSQGEDLNPTDIPYSVGRYNECRKNMYTSELFANDERNIHMGVDIAAPVGENVCSFADGEVFLFRNNESEGDYGPTLIMKYTFSSHELYALYGHLSLDSIENKKVGQTFKRGDVIGSVGSQDVNGGWFPHLHFQLSLRAPKKADMPGVVSAAEHEKALATYPDPQWVLGELYSPF